MILYILLIAKICSSTLNTHSSKTVIYNIYLIENHKYIYFCICFVYRIFIVCMYNNNNNNNKGLKLNPLKTM